MAEKLTWQGTLVSVQPRIRLTRSFDERTHSYLGYPVASHPALKRGPREA